MICTFAVVSVLQITCVVGCGWSGDSHWSAEDVSRWSPTREKYSYFLFRFLFPTEFLITLKKKEKKFPEKNWAMFFFKSAITVKLKTMKLFF